MKKKKNAHTAVATSHGVLCACVWALFSRNWLLQKKRFCFLFFFCKGASVSKVKEVSKVLPDGGGGVVGSCHHPQGEVLDSLLHSVVEDAVVVKVVGILRVRHANRELRHAELLHGEVHVLVELRGSLLVGVHRDHVVHTRRHVLVARGTVEPRRAVPGDRVRQREPRLVQTVGELVQEDGPRHAELLGRAQLDVQVVSGVAFGLGLSDGVDDEGGALRAVLQEGQLRLVVRVHDIDERRHHKAQLRNLPRLLLHDPARRDVAHVLVPEGAVVLQAVRAHRNVRDVGAVHGKLVDHAVPRVRVVVVAEHPQQHRAVVARQRHLGGRRCAHQAGQQQKHALHC
eukprot:Rhum_TRINITY_DN558_c0_g1::Rhum_TRINITY_DN558_c0_g1_i1::g.1766::m.1766